MVTLWSCFDERQIGMFKLFVQRCVFMFHLAQWYLTAMKYYGHVIEFDAFFN